VENLPRFDRRPDLRAHSQSSLTRGCSALCGGRHRSYEFGRLCERRVGGLRIGWRAVPPGAVGRRYSRECREVPACMGGAGTMKVTGIRLFPLPPRWLFLAVDTDAGITGWGEPVL